MACSARGHRAADPDVPVGPVRGPAGRVRRGPAPAVVPEVASAGHREGGGPPERPEVGMRVAAPAARGPGRPDRTAAAGAGAPVAVLAVPVAVLAVPVAVPAVDPAACRADRPVSEVPAGVVVPAVEARGAALAVAAAGAPGREVPGTAVAGVRARVVGEVHAPNARDRPRVRAGCPPARPPRALSVEAALGRFRVIGIAAQAQPRSSPRVRTRRYIRRPARSTRATPAVAVNTTMTSPNSLDVSSMREV